jgi:hypothetical protein
MQALADAPEYQPRTHGTGLTEGSRQEWPFGQGEQAKEPASEYSLDWQATAPAFFPSLLQV